MLNPKSKRNNKQTASKDDFGAVTVTANGWSLSIDADGNATLEGTGNATVITKGHVLSGDTPRSPAILKEKLADQAPNIGSVVEGKGIYQGVFILPERHGITLPPLHLWMAPKDLKEYDGIPKEESLAKSFERAGLVLNIAGRSTFETEDNNAPHSYEQALYRYLAARAEHEKDENSLWFIPTKEMFDGTKPGEKILFNGASNTILRNRSKLPERSQMHAYRYTLDPIAPKRPMPYVTCTVLADDQGLEDNTAKRFHSQETWWEEGTPALKQTEKCAVRLVAADFKL